MFLTVFSQVVVLLILISLGFILNKTKVLNENSAKSITDIVLYLVTPAAIINSFIRKFSITLLKNLGIGLIATLLLHILFIAVSRLLIRSNNLSRKNVLQFGAIFSNCGFMSFPLLQALFGNDGLFYGATYVAIFQVVSWSYGVYLMGDGFKSITPKKIALSPGILGFLIAAAIFILQIPIPTVIKEPIRHMAALNTPLPMIIIGYHLANSNFLSGLKDLNFLFSSAIKLFLFPVLAIFGFYLCGLRGMMPISLVICSSAPTAAYTTMFAAKFGKDTSLSVNMVSLTTVFSVISMPLIVTLAEQLLR